MNQFSKRLAKAFEAAKLWPVEQQEAAANVLEQMEKLRASPYEMNADELADIEQALEEARRGEFATDAEVAAVFARHGL